jgi:hypothetical protein
MGSSWDLSRHAVGYRKDYVNQLYPICVCVCVLNIGYCRSPSGNFNEEHDNDKPWVWAKVGCHSGVSKGIVSDSGGMVREENQLVDGQFPQKWSQKKVPVFHSFPFILTLPSTHITHSDTATNSHTSDLTCNGWFPADFPYMSGPGRTSHWLTTAQV